MRKLFMVALGVFFLVGASWASNIKIGVVDVQKIVLESKRGKQAKAQWEKEFKQKKAEIEKKQKEIEKLQNELKKNAAVLSEKAKKAKQEELRKRMMELQFERQEAMRYLQKRNADLVNAILKDALDDIKNFAKKNGYTIILDVTGRVIYHDPSLDLNQQIIKLIDQKK
ncbi:outer membrane protein [Thermosulfidibacter takaii ABI70S6]|uniref:Outer membrane protein n=1 Tax=Thermosulfidibacter takaii (strain DSM 17441 / JCM 13301 / NBRC 103674 / ABI70S6) TaxID=1298851 RepID=A0A0S3QVX1_THET7|nr:OmpH family outer membrane protein [Thermosulfidibacter takaii]BAT72456.1 outer membrane protein [Thermosulfidibacter takaii ABI70S6]